MKKLNTTIASIPSSATLAIAAAANKMVKEGMNVCIFAAGEPDFDTPDPIKKAAIEALKAGKTKYTPANGVAELTKALSEKFLRENGLTYDPSQIIISSGGKHSLALVFQTLINTGDEIIIPTPYWLSYPEMVRIAGGVPVFVKTTAMASFKMTPEQLEAAITAKTVGVVLCSPSNPTGVTYTPAELKALCDVALKHGVTVISDEIYEKMIYDGMKFVSAASFSPEHYENTVTVNGFSKSFSMTGWRLGYTAAPKHFIQAMGALQSHCASAPNTFAQYGAILALTHCDETVAAMVRAFDERRLRIYELLSAIPGILCPRPTGAFYVFPDISSFGMDSITFSKRLLEEQQVAVVPGESFGADECVRLSYACSMGNIEEGMKRLAVFCASLQK